MNSVKVEIFQNRIFFISNLLSMRFSLPKKNHYKIENFNVTFDITKNKNKIVSYTVAIHPSFFFFKQ